MHLVARVDLRQAWGGGGLWDPTWADTQRVRAPRLGGLVPEQHLLWVSADVWANVKVECEPSWQAFQGHCYRLQAEKRSWQESKKACLRAGGDLLSIHSMAELEFITKQIKQGEGLLVHTPVPILSCPRGPGTISPSAARGQG